MKEKINIDVVRFIASFFVIAIHIPPFYDISLPLNFLIVRLLGSLAVPLYIMITGYYVLDKSLNDVNILKKYTFKVLKIYIISMLIYFPINLLLNNFNNFSLLSIVQEIFINGTFFHLWYFPAIILGCWITYFLIKNTGKNLTLVLVSSLYILGLFSDGYTGLYQQIPIFNTFYDNFLKIMPYNKSALFVMPIFLYLGYYIKTRGIKYKKSLLYSVVFFLCMTVESIIIVYYDLAKDYSLYIFLIPTMYFLFIYIINLNNTNNIRLRKASTIIYILHIMVFLFVRNIYYLFNIKSFFLNNSFIIYMLVAVITTMLAFIFLKFKGVKNE